MGLRERVARLNARAAKTILAHQPLVVICRPAGGDEYRAPGIHYDEPGRCPTIVFDGADNRDPPEELLARFRSKNGPGPLFIIEGPHMVEPPLTAPEPYPLARDE